MFRTFRTRPVGIALAVFGLGCVLGTVADPLRPQGAALAQDAPPSPEPITWLPPLVPIAPGGAAESRPPEFNAEEDWERTEREPKKVHGETSGDWGSLSANSVIQQPSAVAAWEDPLRRPEWHTNGSWNCPVSGPLFVFGQVGANRTETTREDMKATARTGVGCKWAPCAGAEFTVRSGPSVSCTDPLLPERVRERSDWLLDVQARWPLLAGVGLEYQGSAAPALTPLDRDWFDQDLRLAFPVCTGGKMRLGAKRHWEYTGDARPANDSMQLYMGLELSH
jgi:hypothetical protein